MSIKSKEVLGSFAKIAASNHMKKQGSLKEMLKKVAKDESLVPAQIEYLTAEANKAVWSELFSLDKKASYDFKPVDPGEIIDELQVKKQTPVIKEASLDYLSAPHMQKQAQELNLNLDPGVDKTASERRNIKAQLQSRMEKIAAAKEEVEVQIMVNKTAIENLENAFIKTAREMVMQTPFTDRAAAVDQIAEFIRSADEKSEVGLNLMKKLSHVLVHQGLIKQADLKAPEEYISQTMPCRKVNGRHALFITIQTIRDKKMEDDRLQHTHEIVDSSLPYLREKIRQL